MKQIQLDIEDEVVVLTGSLGDGAGWIIKSHPENIFDVYEIPMFGGKQQFIDTTDSLLSAITITKSLT